MAVTPRPALSEIQTDPLPPLPAYKRFTEPCFSSVCGSPTTCPHVTLRRSIVLIGILALAFTPSASASLARYVSEAGDSLSLRRGTGTALLVSRDGAVFGNVGRGRVRIFDVARGRRTKVSFLGCERKRYPRPRTVVCIGRGLQFSALGGAWRVTIVGSRINASAVMAGFVRLSNGTAGTYSIRHGRARRWPVKPTTHYLG